MRNPLFALAAMPRPCQALFPWPCHCPQPLCLNPSGMSCTNRVCSVVPSLGFAEQPDDFMERVEGMDVEISVQGKVQAALFPP